MPVSPRFKRGVIGTVDAGERPKKTKAAKSKVVAPRNPKLIRYNDYDEKASLI